PHATFPLRPHPTELREHVTRPPPPLHPPHPPPRPRRRLDPRPPDRLHRRARAHWRRQPCRALGRDDAAFGLFAARHRAASIFQLGGRADDAGAGRVAGAGLYLQLRRGLG
ncbi:MAG: hypothetical protein EOP62_21720, partial [Sphingomonadales bacterium]